MNTKNILKTLALAMLMPAILLTTACSNDDDAVNTENTAKKGYALPVTINEDHGVGSPDHINNPFKVHTRTVPVCTRRPGCFSSPFSMKHIASRWAVLVPVNSEFS